MNSLEKKISSEKPRWVFAQSIGAVLLTVQAAASFLVVPAWVAALTSEWSVVEKTIEGAKVPVDLVNWVRSIPENIETIDDLDAFLEDTETEWIKEGLSNFWNKTRLWAKVWVDVSSQAIWYATDQFSRMKQWVNNLQEMRIQTIIATISAILLYLMIVLSMKTARLWARDSWSDSLRKKSFRKVFNISDEQVILSQMQNLGISNQEQAIEFLNRLTAELRSRED